MKITETLSVKITDIFIDNHVLPFQQRAAYIYCFDFCFDLFLYNLSLLILGIFFHHGWLALVYVFTMSPLKMLAGGMHASSPSPDSKEETPIKMPDCNIFDNATKLVPYIF